MTDLARHPWNTAFEWQRPPVEPRRLSTTDVDGFHCRGWLVIDELIDATTVTHEWVHPLGLRCFDDHPDATPAPVAAGGAVVFSSLTPHRTGPNLTNATRKTYILQYAPDGAEVLHGDAAAGPPERRAIQNDPDRQYVVLSGGDRREAGG